MKKQEGQKVNPIAWRKIQSLTELVFDEKEQGLDLEKIADWIEIQIKSSNEIESNSLETIKNLKDQLKIEHSKVSDMKET